VVGLIDDDPVEEFGVLQSLQLFEEAGVGNLVGGAKEETVVEWIKIR
jgi:hypothetical protein